LISSPTAYPVPPLLIPMRPTEPSVLILKVLLPAIYVTLFASNVGEIDVLVFEKITRTLVIGPRLVISKDVRASAITVDTFSDVITVLGNP
jgi:hypothetical protein